MVTALHSFTASAGLLDAIKRIEVREGPYCSCRNGCRACEADVTGSDVEDLASVTERKQVGTECPCGERCTDEAYLVDGVAYCTRLCLAYDLIWKHDDAQDQSDAAVAAVLEAIEDSFARARYAQLDALESRIALELACSRTTTRPGEAA